MRIIDGNPPDSWYDPLEPKHDIEIKWHREIKPDGSEGICDKCKEVATVEGRIGDVREPGGAHFIYCKNHYETIIEDTLKEIEEYEPDYDDND